jgi:hypothetical protein
MASRQLTEADFTVLSALLMKKIATAGVLADCSGLAVDEVSRTLAELESAGAIFLAEGNAMSTPAGTDMVKEYADRAYGALRGEEFERWHLRFEPLNRQFLAAITAWQMVDLGGSKVPNDHADREYDDGVRARIEGIVEKMTRLLDQLGAHVPRLRRYGERLNAAIEKTYAGDQRFISDVTVDSLHSVWFEMHEDVLLVLGKERNDAGG